MSEAAKNNVVGFILNMLFSTYFSEQSFLIEA